VHPERLLRYLRRLLDVAEALVLSTPDRDLTWGEGHPGPPPNPSHVREWNADELRAFMSSCGFRQIDMRPTRSDDRDNKPHTILTIARG
jgi:hypothetical protein